MELEKKENQGFFMRNYETLLEIIEDKPNFRIPVPFYCFLILIYFF
jgi:hypothetical protein